MVSADSYTQDVTDCPEGKGQEVNGGKERDYGNESVEVGGQIIMGEIDGYDPGSIVHGLIPQQGKE